MEQKTTVIYRKQDLITVSDIARRWGVSRQTIYNLIDEGKISAFKFGFSNSMYVPIQQVKELEKGKQALG